MVRVRSKTALYPNWEDSQRHEQRFITDWTPSGKALFDASMKTSLSWRPPRIEPLFQILFCCFDRIPQQKTKRVKFSSQFKVLASTMIVNSWQRELGAAGQISSKVREHRVMNSFVLVLSFLSLSVVCLSVYLSTYLYIIFLVPGPLPREWFPSKMNLPTLISSNKTTWWVCPGAHLAGGSNSGKLTISTNITFYSNTFICLSFQISFYIVFQRNYREVIPALLIQWTRQCFSKPTKKTFLPFLDPALLDGHC